MFTFCSLYSGSSGNCSIVQSGTTKILIDAGESAKKISEALENINVNPSDICAVLVTHEHSDHIKGLGTFSKKYDIPVFANSETWDTIKKEKDKIDDKNIKTFSFNKFSIGDMEIMPFSIPHDAANPCGFNIFCDNKKISIATDIGHMNSNIINNLAESSFILLEANYDPEVLKCSCYPYPLKQRIAGPLGHLPNEAAGKTISYLSKFGLNNVMLGHLSKENNFPELAYKTVAEQLIENNIDVSSINIGVANRYGSNPIIEVN